MSSNKHRNLVDSAMDYINSNPMATVGDLHEKLVMEIAEGNCNLSSLMLIAQAGHVVYPLLKNCEVRADGLHLVYGNYSDGGCLTALELQDMLAKDMGYGKLLPTDGKIFVHRDSLEMPATEIGYDVLAARSGVCCIYAVAKSSLKSE